jgi:hypothetical protein
MTNRTSESSDVRYWMSPDGGLCTLIGIGRSSVYSLRLTGGKYRRVVAQLYQGASPDDLFREHGEITPLREVNEVRLVGMKKVDEKLCGPLVRVRRRGQRPLEMVLEGGSDQYLEIFEQFRTRLGPSFQVVKVPDSSASWALAGLIYPICVCVSIWASLMIAVLYPEPTSHDSAGAPEGSHKAQFWRAAARLLATSKRTMLLIGALLALAFAIWAIILLSTRQKHNALRRP